MESVLEEVKRRDEKTPGYLKILVEEVHIIRLSGVAKVATFPL